MSALIALPGTIIVQASGSKGPSTVSPWLTMTLEPSSRTYGSSIHFAIESPGSVQSRRSAVSPEAVKELQVDGILGIVRLLGAPYLCVITSSSFAARGPNGSTFHCVTGVEFVRFEGGDADAHGHASLSAREAADEREFIDMMKGVLQSKTFYYATGYEITHTAQRIHGFGPVSSLARGVVETWTRADERFLWNRHMLGEFLDARETLPDIDYWVTPVMNGFVECREVSFSGSFAAVELVLISRRSRHRQGTRFHRRGIDATNNVANFVETEEMLLHSDGRVVSMVQVRGSIPVYWSQEPTLKYTPACSLHPGVTEEHSNMACAGHMRTLNEVYGGRVVAVNLIDTKGDQKMLGDAYRVAVARSAATGADVEYVWFDFHKECRKMRYDRLSRLMDSVSRSLAGIGYFERDGAGNVLKLQHGVVRTNCMDNLDRTNVVQSLFGRWLVVEAMRLTPVSVLNSGNAAFEAVFNSVWADNADVMSKLYSGTGALKTDFTRTGKRTLKGAMQDGVNSLARYFINNLLDGRRQDAWDVLLGRYVPDLPGAPRSKPPSPRTEFTPGSLFAGFLLANIAVVGSTMALFSASGSLAPLRSQVLVGAGLSALVFSVLFGLQLGKGVGPLKFLASKPQFTEKGDVGRASSP